MWKEIHPHVHTLLGVERGTVHPLLAVERGTVHPLLVVERSTVHPLLVVERIHPHVLTVYCGGNSPSHSHCWWWKRMLNAGMPNKVSLSLAYLPVVS
jgi:hypothetical protein